METLELPVIESEDTAPVDFSQNEMDLAAFRLWQAGSRPDEPEEPAR
jgi:hypothetical protein